MATARLVLVNVPEPAEILGEAVALVKSGGVIAFHEADYVAHVCDPPLDAWSRAIELLDSYSAANDIDLFIGRKLPRLLREAGVVDVQINPVIHVYPHGHGRRPILLDFLENLTNRLVEGDLVEREELELIKKAIAGHLADPNTLIVSHLFIQAWGRKP